MLEGIGAKVSVTLCVHTGVGYWSPEYILQSESFLPRSWAVYMTHMQGFYQTLSPHLQWVGVWHVRLMSDGS